jgi:hypothetical protein
VKWEREHFGVCVLQANVDPYLECRRAKDEVGEAVVMVASFLSWPVSSRPIGLGLWPRGTAFLLDGPDALLVSVEVAPQMFARVLHVSGPINPWVKPFGLLDQIDFKSMARDQGKCVSSLLDWWHGIWVQCQAVRPRGGRSAWDFSQFALFLVHLFLHSQLIQNLWNFISLNKICMEHGAKLWFILEKLTDKVRFNGRQHTPSLNLCSSSSKAKT